MLIAVFASAALSNVAIIGPQHFLVAMHHLFALEGVHLLALVGGEMAPDVHLHVGDGVLLFLLVIVFAFDAASAIAAAFFVLGVTLAAAFALILFFVLVVLGLAVALFVELVLLFVLFAVAV